MTEKLEHPSAVQSLFENMKDCEGARGLFELYMELLCGKDVCDPAIIDTEQFQSLWKDYHPDEDEDSIVAPQFSPNKDLYGKAIFIYDANDDSKVQKPIKGILREIKSPRCFLIDMQNGKTEEWEIDSTSDFNVGEDEQLELINAWR